MFKSIKQVAYQVDDIEKAKQWYNEVLKIKPVFDSPFYVSYLIGSSVLTLIPVSGTKKEYSDNIIVYWDVDDIDAVFQRLTELGAKPCGEIRTVLNSRVGRVTDPFGNSIGLISAIAEAKKMAVENKPSESAMIVAFCRALAVLDEKLGRKGPDYLAELFIAEESKQPLKDPASREWIINKLVTPGLYFYFYSRTLYIDDIFSKVLSENIPQIVFLGAGYDTRTIRFKDLIKDTRVFELDILPTQQRKKDLLLKAEIELPKQLTFVPINFKNESIKDVLNKAGYDKTKKTLFIWEGVMYYLSVEDIDSTLSFVRLNSPRGSLLFFDCMTTLLKSPYEGEPFKFALETDKIKPFLQERSFKVLDILAPGDIEKKFLTQQDGTLTGSVMNNFCFVYASV